MKLNSIFLILLTYFKFIIIISAQEEINKGKLLYLILNERRQVITINERSTFTYELNKGLILDVEKETDILLYILVNKTSNFKTILNQTYVFFTTHQTDCDSSKLNSNEIFKIKFPNSYNRLNNLVSNVSDHATTTNAEAFLLIGEIRLKLEHSKTKYYTCLKFDNLTNSFQHQGTDNPLSSLITIKNALPFYAVCIFYFFLLSLSALFSGLNLGLMSLDLTELNILKECGTDREKYYAKKIYRLRERGNFLLCTILLGNVLVNSTSTLILGSYLDGLFAVAGSTILIVIFGEIIPQAACSRYGLAVGTYTRFITYFFMLITSPLSFPLGLILNKVLGKEIASDFSRDKVREMTKQAELEDNQKKFISGALDLKNKCVKDVMVPINDVFKIDINSCLDFETFRDIGENGYSRIPLYEHTEENLIGIILMQDLLVNDPADKLPLRSVHGYFKRRIAKCTVNDKLDRMFETFRKGESHMAFVYANSIDKSEDNREAVGIVTLEDVIEELFQSEIYDESDCKRKNKKTRAREAIKGKLNTLKGDNWNIFVKQEDTSRPLISPQIRKALFQFLSINVKPFTIEFINHKLLDNVLKNPENIKEKLNIADSDDDVYLYKLGEPSNTFIIILDGNAILEIGKDKIVVQAGLFSYYGLNALIDPLSQNSIQDVLDNEQNYKIYVPEFSLKIKNHQRCVYFQITREEWLKLIVKSNIERKYSVLSSPNVKQCNISD